MKKAFLIVVNILALHVTHSMQVNAQKHEFDLERKIKSDLIAKNGEKLSYLVVQPVVFHVGFRVQRGEIFNIKFDRQLSKSNNRIVDSEEKRIINDYNLLQNYPNPFNPKTIIQYSIPLDGSVRLIVFDMLGREVKTLVNSWKPKGMHSVEFNASFLSSGMYFYRLESVNYVKTMKMIVSK